MKKSDVEDDPDFKLADDEPEDDVVPGAGDVGVGTVAAGIPVLPPIVKGSVDEDEEVDELWDHFVFKKLASDAGYTDTKQFVQDFQLLYSPNRRDSKLVVSMKGACLNLVNMISPPKKLLKKVNDMRYPTNLAKWVPTIDVEHVPKFLCAVIQSELFVGTYPHPYHPGEYYLSIFPQHYFAGCTPT